MVFYLKSNMERITMRFHHYYDYLHLHMISFCDYCGISKALSGNTCGHQLPSLGKYDSFAVIRYVTQVFVKNLMESMQISIILYFVDDTLWHMYGGKSSIGESMILLVCSVFIHLCIYWKGKLTMLITCSSLEYHCLQHWKLCDCENTPFIMTSFSDNSL